ncbi:MAG: restriction endonuclease, partial [Desulfobulbus sp.]|nr:restriction endonuclease [Desulfobulbus sp.]
AWFVSLDQYTRTPNEKYKKDFCLQALEDYISDTENEHNYTIPQAKLKIIKSWPFIYWISDEFREKFGVATLKDKSKVAEGLTTANNNRFLRFWWEIQERYDFENQKWVPYAKGGSYNKYFGNMWTVLNWENNGSAIKNNRGASVRNEGYYFKRGITFSSVGTKGVNYRVLDEGCVFDSASRSVFIEDNREVEFVLSALNSKLLLYVASCLNPTVSTTVGDVERLPYPIAENSHKKTVTILTSVCVAVKKHLCGFSLIEKNFNQGPIASGLEIKVSAKKYFNYENHLLTHVLLNEAIINEKIFEIYDLTEHDKTMVLAKEGESIGGLPVTSEARDAYLAETEATKEFPLDAIGEFIKALPTKEFTAEEREAIENGFGSLYQNNNDLEEFCIRHQVNPINVWYWFKQSNVIPQQRMHTLAMEFLTDMIREILMEDEDGIIPLVPNAGEKVLLDRIEEKFREKGFSSAQYSSFDSVLGRPIHEYLNKYFFAELSDHLNLFMYLPKTPFIWHLSSGPEQGFDCYIIIYKWSRDKLMRLRSVYIEHRERSLVNRQSDLSGNESADAQNEKDRIFRQLKEIEAFKAKIDELLAEGYNPILDDGVGKNIAPLQKKKMIPYEVLNA